MSAQIWLKNPKYGHNIGGAVRAAATLGADAVWWTGDRADEDFVSNRGKYRIPREERLRDYSLIAHGKVQESEWHKISEGYTPVCIELQPGAQSLEWFEHPEHAIYMFGPEDGGLNGADRLRGHQFVQIPTLADTMGRDMCLNLGAAVNVVLYDRRMKHLRGEM